MTYFKFEIGFAELKVPHSVRNDSYICRVGFGGGFAATIPHPCKKPRTPCHFDRRETTK